MSNNKSKTAMPANPEDVMRWEKTKLRKRIIAGEWRNDLENHMAGHLDSSRFASWGPPSQALNLFKSVIQQLSILYDRKPIVVNEDLNDEQSDYINSMHLFSKSQVHNDLVVGLRESFIKLFWNPGSQVSDPGVQSALITPDRVVIGTLPNAPTIPVRVEHVVKRWDAANESWREYWDVWDISDPSNPFFVILTTDKPRENVTHLFLPEDEVESYPYINPEDGIPFLPWILYHAKDTGNVFNPNGWNELVSGTMDMALLYSFYIHIVKDASWAQKYGIDVELNGLDTIQAGNASRQEIATDPSSILLFSSKDNKTGSLSTFTTATDAKSVIESIKIFADAIIANIGIPPQDIQKAQSESGIAIKLKRDSIRKFQASFAPNFRLGDIEYLEKAAMISNLFSGSSVPSLPVSGYNIIYTSLPLDNDELIKEIEIGTRLIELGLMSKIDLAMKIDTTLETREEAAEKLQKIKIENS